MGLTLNSDELTPAIVQDATTKEVLMLGYMDQLALDKTKSTGKVTFYSRSKQRMWTKGETSKNYLHVVDIKIDCDGDALLITARPDGPTCHKGTTTCWGEMPQGTIRYLETVIRERKSGEPKDSYIASLFEKGINKIAQKVGEEAVEMVIEAKDTDDSLFLNESADLLFHYLILLQAKGHTFQAVLDILEARRSEREKE